MSIARNPHRPGFTLIELLVVISIIALLIAMLLPALGKSREVAKRIVCASGARMVAIAAEYYSNEENEYFPHPTTQTWVSGVTRNYAGVLVDRDYTSANNFDLRGGCPDGPTPNLLRLDYFGNAYYSGPHNSGSYQQTIGYAINSWAQGSFGFSYPYANPYYRGYGAQRRTDNRVKLDPSNFALVTCAVAPGGAWTTPQGPVLYHTLGIHDAYIPASAPFRAKRHEGVGLPMTMADGHGELILAAEITNQTHGWWWPGFRTPMASMSVNNWYAGLSFWDKNGD